jgi:hypothetical protein
VPGNRDAPTVAAPAATIPFVRNARRLVGRFMLFCDFFIAFPLFQEIVFECLASIISLNHHEFISVTKPMRQQGQNPGSKRQSLMILVLSISS